ncbi:MAG: hypothetical protein ACLTZY_10845 [Alistipes indistinctus]
MPYQLEELQAARLAEGEQEELESLLEELSHAVEIGEPVVCDAGSSMAMSRAC